MMGKMKILVFLLVFTMVFMSFTYVPQNISKTDDLILTKSLNPSVAYAEASEKFHGRIVYRSNGPGSYPLGLGTGFFLGGAGAPVALLRVRNMLTEAFDVISQGADGVDLNDINMGTVSDWGHEGIPIDLADLGIQGYYEADITFELEESGSNTFTLKRGMVRWRAKNKFDISNEMMTMTDSFDDAGSYTLDPANDQIDLKFSQYKGETRYELDVSITHPSRVNGTSEMTAMGITAGIFKARDGRMTFSAPIMGMHEQEIFDGKEMNSVDYYVQGPLNKLNHNVETWRDLMDNQVVVESMIDLAGKAKIVSPRDKEQLTYDSNEPGELKFTLKAEVIEPWREDLESLIWVLPEIEGSELTTVPEDAKGPLVEVTYTGLPKKNNQFGEKEISAYFDKETLCENPDPIKIQVFFPREAYNNPEAEGLSNEDRIPNWFYYWRQTAAGQGLQEMMEYDPNNESVKEDGTKVKINGWYPHRQVPYTDDAWIFYICNLAPDFSSQNLLTGRVTRGIDTFATTVIHEYQHFLDYHEWWGPHGGYDSSLDGDGDYVPDELEPNLGYDPDKKDTKRFGESDDELSAYKAEAKWKLGAADQEDWANPGKQYGD